MVACRLRIGPTMVNSKIVWRVSLVIILLLCRCIKCISIEDDATAKAKAKKPSFTIAWVYGELDCKGEHDVLKTDNPADEDGCYPMSNSYKSIRMYMDGRFYKDGHCASGRTRVIPIGDCHQWEGHVDITGVKLEAK